MIAALGCGAVATPGPSPAMDAVWNGSYAANGACHCTGELDPDVSAMEVDTPLGPRSVAGVCAAVGEGPDLRFDGTRWNRTVYPDAQCGNGPFANGMALLDPDCAGTRRPGEDDCRPIGPAWDLERAFATARDDGPSTVTTPSDDAASVASASEAAPEAAPGTIEIEGIAWRRAPDGTPRGGGRPGSRIVLDGDLWLRADDARFAELDARSGEARRAELRASAATREVEYTDAADAGPAEASAAVVSPQAAPPAPAAAPLATGDRVWQEAPLEPADESPEAFRARQRELVAASRRRERSSELGEMDASAPEGAGAIDDEATLAAALPDGPSDEPMDEPMNELTVGEADDLSPPIVEPSAEAIVATDPGGDEVGAPLAALRLPADVRGSSDEFAYVEAMPKSYEIGGSGVGLEASAEAARRFHLMARVGAAKSYSEIALGVGAHVTPAGADRLTFALTGGIEYGTFELVGTDAEGDRVLEIDDGDAGLFVTVSSRLVVSSRFELSGGVGYSQFHEGDPHGFGSANFHVNRRFDLTSRFEVGDNDQLGIGLRYYY